MALFTIDDLEYLGNEGGNFFNDPINMEEESPSLGSISMILNYSKALSIRKTSQIEEIRMILN